MQNLVTRINTGVSHILNAWCYKQLSLRAWSSNWNENIGICGILNLLLQLISYPLGRNIPKIPREIFHPVFNLQSEFQVTATISLKYCCLVSWHRKCCWLVGSCWNVIYQKHLGYPYRLILCKIGRISNIPVVCFTCSLNTTSAAWIHNLSRCCK